MIVLHTFPITTRQGHQESGFSPVPQSLQYIRMVGLGADSVYGDPANEMVFTVYISSDGNPSNRAPLFINYWYGLTFTSKFTGLPVPNLVNTLFGPLGQYVGSYIQLAVDFNRPMVVGARLEALP